MEHSLFASTPAKLFSGVLLFALLQACGGSGGDRGPMSAAADSSHEQANTAVTAPPVQQMFPTHPTDFPLGKEKPQFDEYTGTWFAADPPCLMIFSQIGFNGKYSKEYSLFISLDLVERHIDIFHDQDCQEKALQMTYSVSWDINSIEMTGHSNAIRIREETIALGYDLDGGSGFDRNITVHKPYPRYILADIHDGKLHFTANSSRFIIDFPRRLNIGDYYTR